MIKNLIFDLGNTLEPSEWNAMRARVETALKFRIPLKFVSVYSSLEKKYNTPFVCRAEGLRDILEKSLKEFGKYDIDAVLNFMKKRYWELEREFYETSNVLDELKKLKKSFKIYIFSNNSKDGVKRPVEIMESLGFHPDGYLSSEELGVKKPDPEFFTKACERFNLNYDESIYFGNSLKNDQPSEKAGIPFVLVYGYIMKGPEDPSTEKIKEFIDNGGLAIDFVETEKVVDVVNRLRR